MNQNNFDTLSQAVNFLTKNGYKEGFEAGKDKIIGNFSKKEYTPEELMIVDFYRFEGTTAPQDQAIVFAINANDGTKGTLIMSYSAEHNQNVDLIKQIPSEK